MTLWIEQFITQYALALGFACTSSLAICVVVLWRINGRHLALERELLDAIDIMQTTIRCLDQENDRLNAIILTTGGVEGRKMLEQPPA
jgi:hypothetical protein